MKNWIGKFFLSLTFIIALNLSAQEKKECEKFYTGIYVKELYDFNSSDYSYGVDCWVWFIGKNRFIESEEIEITNARSYTFSQITNEKKVNTKGDTVYWTSMNCKATINQDWELKKYPFDHQELKFVIEESAYDSREVILIKDPNLTKFYADSLNLQGWVQQGNELVDSSIVKYATNFGDPSLTNSESFYSNITFKINLKRQSISIFFKLFTGCYVAFFVAFLVYFIKPIHVDPRFGLSIGALFAAVGNMYVVDSNMPTNVGFALADQVHVITFIYILISMVISIISLKIYEHGDFRKQKRFDHWSAIAVLYSYIFINFILIASANNWWE